MTTLSDHRYDVGRVVAVSVALGTAWMMGTIAASAQSAFQIEEATIGDIHRAIRQGETTCVQVVEAYVERARAYNGICTQLVTADGGPVAPGRGAVRAGAPTEFPATTVPVREILPGYDDYRGLPIEFGRMEATRSDPGVQQQYGMVVGMEDAGQLNALSTLNLRGERSVTCQAECDAHPSDGALPAHCPAACEAFRRQPDALERAAELDARHGRNPDLDRMPMYCAAFSFKDVFDTTDMRSTGGADTRYAMDAPPRDSTVVAELRAKGAIIYAKANLSEYNAGGGNPGGAVAESRTFGAGVSRSSWAGASCNVYDTAREPGGSSSGSAVSVGANLVTCSLCEETGGSCRQPAWRNGVVGLVTTKGLVPYGGSIGVEPYLDRGGIHCRTVEDTALVLDALRNPDGDFYDPRDIYSALPRALILEAPYASFVVDDETADARPLAGVRIFDFLDAEPRLDYVVAMAKNAVLQRHAESAMQVARAQSEVRGETAHVYTDTRYAAGTWDHERRVVIKAEVVRLGDREPRDNPRFVVTNLRQTPRFIYEKVYCARGDIENRIKELLDGLQIDRTSCCLFSANQLRVFLTAAAYVLMQELRLRAARTACARSQVTWLRDRLLKLGVHVVRSVRRVVLHLPRSTPHLEAWRHIALALGARAG